MTWHAKASIISSFIFGISMGLSCSKQSSIYPQTKIYYHELINLIHPTMHNDLLDHTNQQMYLMWVYSYSDFKKMIYHIVENRIAIRPHHFNQMCMLMSMESQLDDPEFHERLSLMLQRPAYCESWVQDKLDELCLQLNEEIHQQSEKNHLLHHGLPHAFEVQNRFEIMMAKHHLLSGNESLMRLMRQLILFFVKNHDLIQVKIDEHASVEESTATICKNRICDVLQLDEQNPLTLLIDYLSKMMIVFGTTVIWGNQNSKHLDYAHLYLTFRGLVHQQQTENAPQWRKEIDVLMLLMGICDKYPAALTDATAVQCRQEDYGSFHNLSKFLKRPLLLQTLFVQSKAMHSKKATDYDFQAFLIAVIPHIAMQFEFYVKTQLVEAHRFYTFVELCRENFMRGEINFEWMKNEMLNYQIQTIFNTFFIQKLPQEILFCTTLRDDLAFCKRFLNLHYPQFVNIFDEKILENNIRFLEELQVFFSTAKMQDKDQVIEELLMNMVIQQGFLLKQKYRQVENNSQKTLVPQLTFTLYSPKRAGDISHSSDSFSIKI